MTRTLDLTLYSADHGAWRVAVNFRPTIKFLVTSTDFSLSSWEKVTSTRQRNVYVDIYS